MSETANTARQCVGGGYLVGPVFRVPTNFAYFQTPVHSLSSDAISFAASFAAQPCASKAVCTTARTPPQTPQRSLQNPTGANRDSSCRMSKRTYCCKCSLVIIRARQATHMPNDVWTCQGHPPVPGNEGSLLPTMTLSAAQDFAVALANGQLQQSINLIAITFTDGTGTRALPANIGLRQNGRN